jgi:hypothetical protein
MMSPSCSRIASPPGHSLPGRRQVPASEAQPVPCGVHGDGEVGGDVAHGDVLQLVRDDDGAAPRLQAREEPLEQSLLLLIDELLLRRGAAPFAASRDLRWRGGPLPACARRGGGSPPDVRRCGTATLERRCQGWGQRGVEGRRPRSTPQYTSCSTSATSRAPTPSRARVRRMKGPCCFTRSLEGRVERVERLVRLLHGSCLERRCGGVGGAKKATTSPKIMRRAVGGCVAIGGARPPAHS